MTLACAALSAVILRSLVLHEPVSAWTFVAGLVCGTAAMTGVVSRDRDRRS